MLKKGSKEAKEFMAKIRASKGKKKVAKTKKTVKKKSSVKKQTGSSNKLIDKKIQAKAPGKRNTATGKTYYERRANRSDKGKLLGIGDISLNSIGTELYLLEGKILNFKEQKRISKNVKSKKELQYSITILTKQFKALKEYLNTKAKYI